MADFLDAIFDADAATLLLGAPDAVGSDSVPPTLTLTPAGGAIQPYATITVEATDDQALALVTVYAGDRVVYDGTSFTADYRTSTKTLTANGVKLDVRRSPSWPVGASFVLDAAALDEGGNLARVTSMFVALDASAPMLPAGGLQQRRPRRWLDAQTLDYVVEAGGLKQDEGFTSQVVLALATRLGSCQVYPAFGSRLHQVKRADETGRRLAEAYAKLAIAHLSIKDLRVVATLSKSAPGRISLLVAGKKSGLPVNVPYNVDL
jgi:phage gp46-like protein